jgi:hypothetical protein
MTTSYSLQTCQQRQQTSGGGSIAKWNLRNEYNQKIAAGVYFYHISSPIGSTTGKFIVIL